jgi:type I restriction enzyme S subunit
MERRKIRDLIADDAILEVQDGNHGEKHPTSADYVEEGIPFLMARDFQDGRVDLQGACKIPKSLGDSLRIGFARAGDVLLTHKGTVGLVAIVPNVSDYVMLTPQVTYYRANPKKLLNKYLKYAFQAPFFRDQLNSFSAQSTRPYIGITAQKELQLDYPALYLQRRIAEILSAYDELIENSQRRIKILEAMARAHYREWFVHFRFPGHESVPRVPSPLGEIPKGWEVKRLPECVHINPRVAVPREGEKPFVPMGCLSNDSMLISGIESRAGNSGAKFQNGDTLFARITPCLENGKTGFVQFLPDGQSVGFGSTEFIVLRSRTLTPELVYLLARSDEFRGVAIKSMSGATGRQRVQEKCFDDLRMAQPPRALLDQFGAIVAPAFRLTYELHLQIQNLRHTRDLLLPRLLSGRIDVSTFSEPVAA